MKYILVYYNITSNVDNKYHRVEIESEKNAFEMFNKKSSDFQYCGLFFNGKLLKSKGNLFL